MALNNITALKASLEAWGDTNGTTSTFSDDLIAMATALFNSGSEEFEPLRITEMVVTQSLTYEPLTPGHFRVPDDFLGMIRLAELAGGRRRNLTFMSHNLADIEYSSRPAGLATHYTIVGSYIDTFPATENDLEIKYYEKIPLLVEVTQPTNWLLIKQPMLYLHALLFQQALLRRDDEMAQRSAQIVKSLIKGLHKSDEMDVYSRAPILLSEGSIA